MKIVSLRICFKNKLFRKYNVSFEFLTWIINLKLLYSKLLYKTET